jgi:hypothetical protein
MKIRRGSLQQLVIVTIKFFQDETGPTLYAWPWNHQLTLMPCSEAQEFPESYELTGRRAVRSSIYAHRRRRRVYLVC